jgi:hypothetical protein
MKSTTFVGMGVRPKKAFTEIIFGFSFKSSLEREITRTKMKGDGN